MESASVTLGHATGDHHHGPPEANKSSKVDQTTLGLLIFLVTEAMLFGGK